MKNKMHLKSTLETPVHLVVHRKKQLNEKAIGVDNNIPMYVRSKIMPVSFA